jgi:protein-tyrosine phosphatase
MSPLFDWLFGQSTSSSLNLSDIAVDMHSHLLPGIDDGSRSMDESIAMIASFERLGYRKIITTPHIMNEVYPNTREIILNKWSEVQEEMQAVGLGIQLEAAAEYFADEHLLELIHKKELLTIGGSYVLFEFSFFAEPERYRNIFFELQTSGYKPILAHFERYPYYHGSIEKAHEFREMGINIQLNINSLVGHYGPGVRKQAERLVTQGAIDFIGTDCHRIQHLQLLEDNVQSKYIRKLNLLPLKNKELI